jgi:hypothetical protein
MEIGEYKLVNPSKTLEGLQLENSALKNRQNTLIAFAVGSAIIALIVYARYLQMKEELKKKDV